MSADDDTPDFASGGLVPQGPYVLREGDCVMPLHHIAKGDVITIDGEPYRVKDITHPLTDPPTTTLDLDAVDDPE